MRASVPVPEVNYPCRIYYYIGCACEPGVVVDCGMFGVWGQVLVRGPGGDWEPTEEWKQLAEWPYSWECLARGIQGGELVQIGEMVITREWLRDDRRRP